MNAENQKQNARQENKKPRKFIVYIERTYPDIGVDIRVITDKEYEYPQEFAERWFQDPAVIRIYELVQLYAIGKVRGQ